MLKNISKNKWLLIMVLVGFFLIMFDQNISLGRMNPYPAYETSTSYNLEFQVYSLNYAYGAGCEVDGEGFYTGDIFFQLTLDVFPDVLGFVILAFAFAKMKKFSRIFGMASLMAWVSVGLYAFIHLMPFFLNGMQLTYMVFWLSIAMYGMEAIVGYIFICAVYDTLAGYEHRQSRKAIALAWLGMIVLEAVVCVIRWIAAITPGLLVAYEMIDLFVSLLFYYLVMRDADYIVKEREV